MELDKESDSSIQSSSIEANIRDELQGESYVSPVKIGNASGSQGVLIGRLQDSSLLVINKSIQTNVKDDRKPKNLHKLDEKFARDSLSIKCTFVHPIKLEKHMAVV